jgi:hypothetical protein
MFAECKSPGVVALLVLIVLSGSQSVAVGQTCAVIAGVSGSPVTPPINCTGISPQSPVTINTTQLVQALGSVDPASLGISCTASGGGSVSAAGYCYNASSGTATGATGSISVEGNPTVPMGITGTTATFVFDSLNYRYANNQQGQWISTTPINVNASSCNCPACWSTGPPPSVCATCSTGNGQWQDCPSGQTCNTQTKQCVTTVGGGSGGGTGSGTGGDGDQCSSDSDCEAGFECMQDHECFDTEGDPTLCDISGPGWVDCGADCSIAGDCEGSGPVCFAYYGCDEQATPILIDLGGGGYDLTSAARGVRFDIAG